MDHSSSLSLMTPNTLGWVVQWSEYKFPIETYAGLDQTTAERIAKIEAETNAIRSQRSGLARSSQDLHVVATTTDVVSYNACVKQ